MWLFHCVSWKLMTSDVHCNVRGLCCTWSLPLNSQAGSRCFNSSFWVQLFQHFTPLYFPLGSSLKLCCCCFVVFLKQKRKKNRNSSYETFTLLPCVQVPSLPHPNDIKPPHTKRRHHSFLRLTDRDNDSSVKQTAINKTSDNSLKGASFTLQTTAVELVRERLSTTCQRWRKHQFLGPEDGGLSLSLVARGRSHALKNGLKKRGALLLHG